MKNFGYILDDKNRIVTLSENNTELPQIQLNDITDIKLGQDGIINGKVVFIGLTDDEKNRLDIITNKKPRLQELKKLLEETDYKVIKCYEASLLNEEMPYNLQELLAERKAWRQEINNLEFQISILG